MLYFIDGDRHYFAKKEDARKRWHKIGGRLFVKTYFEGTKEVLPDSDYEWMLRSRQTIAADKEQSL